MSLHSNKFIALALVCLMAISANAQKTGSKSTAGPLPNANQLRWQDMEMYAFIHYSLNTYTSILYSNFSIASDIATGLVVGS